MNKVISFKYPKSCKVNHIARTNPPNDEIFITRCGVRGYLAWLWPTVLDRPLCGNCARSAKKELG